MWVRERVNENESSRVRNTTWEKQVKDKGSGGPWEREVDRKRLLDYQKAGLVIHEHGL